MKRTCYRSSEWNDRLKGKSKNNKLRGLIHPIIWRYNGITVATAIGQYYSHSNDMFEISYANLCDEIVDIIQNLEMKWRYTFYHTDKYILCMRDRSRDSWVQSSLTTNTLVRWFKKRTQKASEFVHPVTTVKCSPVSMDTEPISGLILGLHRANGRRRYFVTTSLIGWLQA